MSDITLFPDLTKPATVLIEKIADATGVLYEPRRIRKRAEAEAEAKITLAKADLQITDLQRRAMTRFVQEEAKKQQNMEDIVDKAIPLLEENSKPENIEEDWIANFFDKCRIVSNEDMQTLWAKILAGEANQPKTFSLRTLDIVKNITAYEAEIFVRFCKGIIEFSHYQNEFGVIVNNSLGEYLLKRFYIGDRVISLLKEVGIVSSSIGLRHLKFEKNKINYIEVKRGSLFFSIKLSENQQDFFYTMLNLTTSGVELLSLIELEDDFELLENYRNLFLENLAVSELSPIWDEETQEKESLKIAVKSVRSNEKKHLTIVCGGMTIRQLAEEYGFPIEELAKYNNLSPESKPSSNEIYVPEYFFDDEGNVK